MRRRSHQLTHQRNMKTVKRSVKHSATRPRTGADADASVAPSTPKRKVVRASSDSDDIATGSTLKHNKKKKKVQRVEKNASQSSEDDFSFYVDDGSEKSDDDDGPFVPATESQWKYAKELADFQGFALDMEKGYSSSSMSKLVSSFPFHFSLFSFFLYHLSLFLFHL